MDTYPMQAIICKTQAAIDPIRKRDPSINIDGTNFPQTPEITVNSWTYTVQKLQMGKKFIPNLDEIYL